MTAGVPPLKQFQFPDLMGIERNALAVQGAGTRNALLETQAEAAQFNLKELQMAAPAKREELFWKSVMMNAPTITKNNYSGFWQDMDERAQTTGIENRLPHPSVIDQMTPEEFDQQKNELMTSVQDEIKKREVAVKERQVGVAEERLEFDVENIDKKKNVSQPEFEKTIEKWKTSPEGSAEKNFYKKRLEKMSTVKDSGMGKPDLKTMLAFKNQVDKSTIVTDFRLTKLQSQRLDEALNEAGIDADEITGEMLDPDTLIAVDQALITIFNKMLDPTSVVRESEYARTPQDQGVMSRLKGKWGKIKEGGAGLTDTERQGIARMARRFFKLTQERARQEATNIRRIAEENNLNPRDILGPDLFALTDDMVLKFDAKGNQIK